MKSVREGFGDGLLSAGQTNKNIILVGADLNSATKASGFASAFPDRYIECGIAENNAIGVATGLALEGYTPVLTSFASFLTGKTDTIRCSVCFNNAPVVLIGTHSGLSPGLDGSTQSGHNDLALMRSLPGMRVYQTSTYESTRLFVQNLLNKKIEGPTYIRIGRQVVDLKTAPEVVEPNSWILYNHGPVSKPHRRYILSSGCLLDTAIKVGKAIRAPVVDIQSVKPFPSDEYFEGMLSEASDIIVIEDHSIIGGLGSAVLDKFQNKGMHIQRFGIPDEFISSGPPADLYNKYGLTTEKIIDKIRP